MGLKMRKYGAASAPQPAIHCQPGNYIRKWLPQLQNLPNHLIHQPNKINLIEEKAYNFKINQNYPNFIVNHQIARDKALEQFKKLKNK